MTQRFKIGDAVRIDIPDETDPDHNRLHGRQGEITTILEDDAGKATGDVHDTVPYRVQLKDGTEADVRWCDVRPP